MLKWKRCCCLLSELVCGHFKHSPLYLHMMVKSIYNLVTSRLLHDNRPFFQRKTTKKYLRVIDPCWTMVKWKEKQSKSQWLCESSSWFRDRASTFISMCESCSLLLVVLEAMNAVFCSSTSSLHWKYCVRYFFRLSKP